MDSSKTLREAADRIRKLWFGVSLPADAPNFSDMARAALQQPAAEPVAIVRELQSIRVGMLDQYQAATILERLVQKAQAIDVTAPEPADMRAVCEALGFDPENHHNAAKCPYCAPIPEPATTDVEREEIARVIDPEAWEEYLLEDGRLDQEVASIFQEAYEDSLAKADQIKALFASKGVGEVK